MTKDSLAFSAMLSGMININACRVNVTSEQPVSCSCTSHRALKKRQTSECVCLVTQSDACADEVAKKLDIRKALERFTQLIIKHNLRSHYYSSNPRDTALKKIRWNQTKETRLYPFFNRLLQVLVCLPSRLNPPRPP